MSVGLWVLAGIIAFLCVEKFVRLVKGKSVAVTAGDESWMDYFWVKLRIEYNKE